MIDINSSNAIDALIYDAQQNKHTMNDAYCMLRDFTDENETLMFFKLHALSIVLNKIIRKFSKQISEVKYFEGLDNCNTLNSLRSYSKLLNDPQSNLSKIKKKYEIYYARISRFHLVITKSIDSQNHQISKIFSQVEIIKASTVNQKF